MIKGIKYRVSSWEEYRRLKNRVAKGASFLEGKWLDKKYIREQTHYKEMAMSLLHWDLEHGVVEKGIQQMISNERE